MHQPPCHVVDQYYRSSACVDLADIPLTPVHLRINQRDCPKDLFVETQAIFITNVNPVWRADNWRRRDLSGCVTCCDLRVRYMGFNRLLSSSAYGLFRPLTPSASDKICFWRPVSTLCMFLSASDESRPFSAVSPEITTGKIASVINQMPWSGSTVTPSMLTEDHKTYTTTRSLMNIEPVSPEITVVATSITTPSTIS